MKPWFAKLTVRAGTVTDLGEVIEIRELDSISKRGAGLRAIIAQKQIFAAREGEQFSITTEIKERAQ